MTNTLNELKKLLPLSKARKITLRRKLMLYLLCLILIALSITLLILAAIGGPLQAERRISQVMEHQLLTSYDKLVEELEVYAGYGLQMSRQLSRDIENYLEEKKLSMSDLNDRADELLELQRILYTELNTTIRLGRSSGVFAAVDATVNTQIPEARDSRCGVYLRLINVSSSVILNPETILFRGNPELSRDNGLELHNRWNMEFRTDELPKYLMFANLPSVPKAEYFWTSRMNLKNTWENIMLLLLPLHSDAGEFYGMCGIELNTTHFNLEYPAEVSPYGCIVTVFAPMEDGNLRLDLGMVGDMEGTWLQGTESLSVLKGKTFNTVYHSPNSGDYYGLQRYVAMQGNKDEKWAVVVLIPRDGCDRFILRNHVYILGVTAGIAVILIAFALLLSKRFVKPILQSFQDLRQGEQTSSGHYSITELEELHSWLATKEKALLAGDLPPQMAELFDTFVKNVKTLTRAEYNIFRYYLNGYEVSQIPSEAFISMSTVKKHNGNIYRKLGISSNDELMLYLDLFRRCGYLEQLQWENTEGFPDINKKD